VRNIGFKPVNDTYGHDIGDLALVELAKRLSQHLRDEDTVARLGGDEFALLFTGQNDENQVNTFIERLLTKISEPYFFENYKVSLSASIGIASYPVHANTVDELLKESDKAMYVAKKSGGNTFHYAEKVISSSELFARKKF